MNIQWFPGHIARARREIKEHLKDIDIVIEIIDARCPKSSINFLNEEIKGKKRLIIVNKIDLVDKTYIESIISKVLREDDEILYLDSRDNNIKRIVDKKIDKLCVDIIKRNESRGIIKTILKAMVVGMPNVGKSTFINSYVKKKVNKVENTPGVTKRVQWTKISDKLLLLDTPGVTVKKFENDDVGLNLALVGSINDDIIEKQDLVYEFLNKIKTNYFDDIKNRYRLKYSKSDSETIDIMNEIASNNACLKKGGDYNYDKVSNLIITDFRKGLIGKISLE